MKMISWTTASAAQRRLALKRSPQTQDKALRRDVAAIVQDVKKNGDKALRAYSHKFDGGAPPSFRVSEDEITQALRDVPKELRAALTHARKNIQTFHKAQRPKNVKVETSAGVTCSLQWRAQDTVGLYIPSGTAPLLSTVLMLAVPARLAKCRRLVLCSPAKKGKIDPAILAAARLCGVDEVYALGGAQAIAAMAYGTVSLPKTDKIFGPGNAYVTTAKEIVAQDPEGAAIDMPAGPSEVMVMADASAHPAWVAADLLAQAEHDTAAQAILVTTDEKFAQRVAKEVTAQLKLLSRRAIASASLKNARAIIVADRAEAIDVANLYAPEHLIVHDARMQKYLSKIHNVGSVFMGPFTPESAGDYASGTNHVLPTSGYARAVSGLTLQSFMKTITVQSLSREGLKRLAPTIVTMAEAEGLDAHARAVRIRLETSL